VQGVAERLSRRRGNAAGAAVAGAAEGH